MERLLAVAVPLMTRCRMTRPVLLPLVNPKQTGCAARDTSSARTSASSGCDERGAAHPRLRVDHHELPGHLVENATAGLVATSAEQLESDRLDALAGS